MTKKYILTEDKIQSAVGTSAYPPSSTAVKNALDGKVDKEDGKGLSTNDFTDALRGKLDGIEANAEVNVIETVKVGGVAQSVSDKAVNVPIATTSGLGVVKVGTGLGITAEGLLTADVQLHFEVFTVLPTPSETYKNTIALIKKTGTTGDVYNEYVCVKDATTEQWAWELIGSTEFVLNIVQDASGIKINNTVLQAATNARAGLATAAQITALETATSDIAELETSVSGLDSRLTTAEGDIEALESGKADAADVEALEGRVEAAEGDITALESGKVDKVTGSSLVPDSKVTAYDAHIADSDIHVTAEQKTAWTAKQAALSGTSGDVVTYTSTAGTTGSIGFDTAPTASSQKLVKSGAIKTALDAKVDEVEGTVAIGKDSTGYYFNE